MKKLITLIITGALALSTAATSYAVSYSQLRSKTSVSTTPIENLFRLEGTGTNYVLLDSTEEGYMIVPQGYSGSVMYDPDATVWFDLEDTNNIAYWLNNTFITDGILPKEMAEHLVERDWPMEDPVKDSEDMFVRCKVALLSQTEYLKYDSKFGFRDGYENTNDSNYFFLRSRSGQTILVGSASGGTYPGKPARNYGTKPVFFLDDNFFKEHKVDLISLGDNVRKAIMDKTTDAELRKIYSDKDVKTLKRAYLPQAQSVKCTGLPMVGQVLTGSYEYYSPDGVPENGTAFRWLVSDTVNGTYSAIPGATSITYTVEEKYIGKYIRFEVTPQTSTLVGRSAMSETRDLYMEEAIKPEANNVVLKGDPYVGNRLVLDYNYFDANQDLEGDTRIIFQISKDGKHFSDHQDARYRVQTNREVKRLDDIEGTEYVFENYNNGKDYVVKKEDVGCYIRGKLVPRSVNFPYIGKVIYTEPILVYERPTATFSVTEESGTYLGSYTFDGKMNAEDMSEFGWEYSPSENGKYATVSKTKDYTPTGAGYYRFFVIPQNGIGQKGEKVVSEIFQHTDNRTGSIKLKTGQKAELIPSVSSNAYEFLVSCSDPASVKVEGLNSADAYSVIKDGLVYVVVVCYNNNAADVTKPVVCVSSAGDMTISDMSCTVDGESRQIEFMSMQ